MNPMRPLIGLLVFASCSISAAGTVYFGNGTKVGEVTSSSAILWTRLTSRVDYKQDGPEFRPPQLSRGADGRTIDASIAGPEHGYCRQVPKGASLHEMQTTMPGIGGEVRLRYWPENDTARSVTVDWSSVDDRRDFTRHFRLGQLQPGTRYEFSMEGRSDAVAASSAKVSGSFRTAPGVGNEASISFTVVTGQRWNTRDDTRGQKIYKSMDEFRPDFFVHTGDIVYYDNPEPWASHLDIARMKWNRSYAQPFLRDFHNRTPSYFIKDDHDSWQNDCWPTQASRMGDFTWEQGRKLFLEQVPMGDRTYRTIRWGKHLQVWLVEGRDFRSPNDAPDGPDKTIWGKEQHAWFRKTVTESDATYRVLISPTPVLGPDHLWKEGTSDNHVASRRTWEGSRLRDFIASQKNMFIVCGDRHWQYASVDPDSGLREYSCGPTTDKHATELKNDDHRLLKFLGEHGGFLSVSVEVEGGQPSITFRHHDVEGKVVNTDSPGDSQS